jgi:cobalt/nickel transport system permease protein
MSVEFSALGTALELSFAGTSPANLAIPAMAGIHALIGIGEGLITVGALAFIKSSRHDLLKTGKESPAHGNLAWISGLVLALLLAIASPLASTHPDGLMWVAHRYGFINKASNPLLQLIPHYLLPGVKDRALATILAAVLGTIIVFAVTVIVAYSRRRKTR